MIFSSPVFLVIFFPITLACYFLFGRKNIILLAASLVFYGWGEFLYTSLLLVSIAINYFCGLLIHKAKTHKKAALVLGVAANLSILGFFKYAGFIVENVNVVLVSLGFSAIAIPRIYLPLGISFFTFQAISYLVDLYREQAQVQRNPLNLALYISLFPQLIAGPIVRYTQIADALENRIFKMTDFLEGIERLVIGLAKKLILADTLALAADRIFLLKTDHLSSPIAWFGILCFTFQIYFDFSGYSDMAIGLGRMFGFKFLENFNYPYLSKSITEFWKRWHISLSTWLRDYLFLPIAYATMRKIPGVKLYRIKAETWGYSVGMLGTMFLGGLWHGASWNFVIWGLFHGFFAVLERVWLGKKLKKLWSPLRYTYTMFLVIISWVFFRTAGLSEAMGYLKAMFFGGGWAGMERSFHHISDNYTLFVLLISFIFSLPVGQFIGDMSKKLVMRVNSDLASQRLLAANDIIYGIFLCIITYISFAVLSAQTYQAFIYFRF